MVVFILKRTARAMLSLWAITLLTFALGVVMAGKFMPDLCRAPHCQDSYYDANASPWPPPRWWESRCDLEDWTELLSDWWSCLEREIPDPLGGSNTYPLHPISVKYLHWTRNLVTRMEFGRSIVTDDQAMGIILARAPNTAKLWLAATGIVAAAGLLISGLTVIRHSRVWDAMSKNLSLIVLAVPLFWLALIADSLFYGLFPGTLFRFALAAALLAIAVFTCATVSSRRLIEDILKQDFIKQAYLKGASSKRVFWKHTLPHILSPPSKLVSPIFWAFTTYTIVLEVTLGWRGIGYAIWQAFETYDYPVILAAFMMLSALYVVSMFALDILYAFLDPRIRRPQRLAQSQADVQVTNGQKVIAR